jgi:hypothetical protein
MFACKEKKEEVIIEVKKKLEIVEREPESPFPSSFSYRMM